MKKDPGLIFRLCLLVGDAVAIILAFLFAYFLRTHLDQRPYYFESDPLGFILPIIILLPIWLIILALFGLYQRNVFAGRSRWPEVGRLLAASFIGVMAMITYGFFTGADLFPVRLMAIYAALATFIALLLIRSLLRLCRHRLHRRDFGVTHALIIGNSPSTEHLINYMSNFPEAGYRISGVITSKKYIPRDLKIRQFSSLKEALEHTRPDAIFQTDERSLRYIYRESIEHHLQYYFVPAESDLSAHMGQLELIGSTPAIAVKVTPLMGNARVAKRLMDLTLSGLALIIAAIPMGIIWLISKISDPRHSPIFSDERLSRYDQKVKIYKFRSMKPEYSGLTPEEAFTKMDKPELIKKYRANGDFLEKDPRITGLGRFLRKTSLDELPQLVNVFKGDISLVGPRALIPGELRDYGDRSMLLSVKSGLTGLAQVSGRRDISFDERRALDIYYIQNWSIWLDVQILFRTVATVLKHEGAK